MSERNTKDQEFIQALKDGWWAHRTIFPHVTTPEFAAEKREAFATLLKQHGISIGEVIAEGPSADVTADPDYHVWTPETKI
jgi:hypothetical protein